MSSVLAKPITNATITGTITSGAPGPQAGVQCAINDNGQTQVPVGNSAGSFSWAWSFTQEVTNGTPYVLDVQTPFVDNCGNSIAAVNVCAIKLSSQGTSGQTLTLGGGSNPIFGSNTWDVQPPASDGVGGDLLIVNCSPGYAVGSGAKNLQITVASGSNVPFTLTLMGN